jgi:hypothetical protein
MVLERKTVGFKNKEKRGTGFRLNFGVSIKNRSL